MPRCQRVNFPSYHNQSGKAELARKNWQEFIAKYAPDHKQNSASTMIFKYILFHDM
jgi:hypothetical protein